MARRPTTQPQSAVPNDVHSNDVAGIVLASGLSRRFGQSNKLLSPLGGVPIVRRTVQAYLESSLDPLLVVVGFEGEAVATALEGLPVHILRNSGYAQGQSRALVRAVADLPATVLGAVIGVGDQPLLTATVINTLIDTFRRSANPIVAPRYGGQRGNPVLFARSLFPELIEVQGDQGGRGVLARRPDQISLVDFTDPRLGADIDTPDDLQRLDVDWTDDHNNDRKP